MVLFFSGTGNTRLVAEELAKKLDDTTFNLLDCIRNKDYSEIHSEKPFILCVPIYVSEIPKFIERYFKNVPLTGSDIIYGIFTNGGYSGIAGVQLKRVFRAKGMRYKGYAEFKFPSNHLTNKGHKDISDEEIAARIIASMKKTESVAKVIRTGQEFKSRHIWLIELIATVPVAPILMHFTQKTDMFYAKDSCIACGKCEKLCPDRVIKMVDGRPTWNKSHCTHCMSCIQNCPREAIEFGTVTEGKRRYSLSRYKDVLENSENNLEETSRKDTYEEDFINIDLCSVSCIGGMRENGARTNG
jgi:ferredoxin